MSHFVRQNRRSAPAGGIGEERLLTDAEVLQEILHRYTAIGRADAIQPAFNALLGVVDEVFPVDQAAVKRAKQIVLGHKTLSVHDARHLATMQIHGVRKILSFDRGFDSFPGIARLSSDPASDP